MSSSLVKLVIAAGLVAGVGVRLAAPRVGVAPARMKAPAAPAYPPGPRLIPPPPGMG